MLTIDIMWLTALNYPEYIL